MVEYVCYCQVPESTHICMQTRLWVLDLAVVLLGWIGLFRPEFRSDIREDGEDADAEGIGYQKGDG